MGGRNYLLSSTSTLVSLKILGMNENLKGHHFYLPTGCCQFRINFLEFCFVKGDLHKTWLDIFLLKKAPIKRLQKIKKKYRSTLPGCGPKIAILLKILKGFFGSMFGSFCNKVHMFWEDHKILQNLYCRFDWHYIGQIYGGDFQ